jgi:hypothetical protein
MAIPLDPTQIASFDELLISQVVQQEALTKALLAAKEVDNPKSREGVLNQIGKGL